MKFTPPANDAHKVEIAQFPQGVIQPNIPSQFLVRKNGAKGDIEAKVNLYCMCCYTIGTHLRENLSFLFEIFD